jgi:hypothetical protein
MIYWLVMYIFAGNNASMLHVGNYRSMENCLVAAQKVQYLGTPSNVPQYVCIQANENNTQPPPS